MKKAILVVSFGTSYQDALKNNILAVETAIGDAFPGWEVRRAFTSSIIMKKLLRRDGMEIDTVSQAMEKLEQAVDKLVMDAQADQRGSFLDEVVMAEVLGEIKEIAARGGISCACGSRDYGIKVGFSDVDLICAHCGATLRLDAATPDDIDAVCTKYTLTIPGKKED